MGTDRSDIDHPCPCGSGVINVEQESPDHPWATASQIHYSGTLKCGECAKTYAIVNEGSGIRPYLTMKADLEAQDEARAEYWTLDRKFRQHALATSLEPRLIAEIDQALAKSMAAAHRVLTNYGLAYESLASYRKHPTDGATAVAAASGYTMAKIGTTLGATAEERAAFATVNAKLDELSSVRRKPTPVVKTGHPWMRA